MPDSHMRSGAQGAGPTKQVRRNRTIAAAAALVVIIGGAFGYTYFNSSNSSAPKASKGTNLASTTTSATANTTSAATCPLTGLPAPGGVVPQRPALAVKIGNDPGARPQSGLQKADIIYEVQAEGGITRYIAVFQCHSAPAIGPVRSVRWVDWHVVEPLGKPILAFAGGINPDRAAVSQKSYLFDADFFRYYNAYYRISTRVAPENLYTSTKLLYSLDPSKTPPNSIFTFSKSIPQGGQAVSGVFIPYSYAAQINWTWSASKGVWLRSYGSQADISNSGVQQNATNVIIQKVPIVSGPYVETGTNVYGVHSITVGTGPAIILRNGREYKGYWKRNTYADPTTYYTSSGQQIPLNPGRTWVEIVPNGVSVTVS